MKRRRSKKWTMAENLMKTILAAAVAAYAALAGPAYAAQPMTLEDALHMESLSSVQFSPDGKWSVVVRSVPPVGHPSWGYFNGAYVRSRVFVARGDGSDLHEIVNTKDIHYALLYNGANMWSPDGRGLLLLAARQKAYGIAYYDLARRRITALPGHSVFGLSSWLPDGRVVYVTVNEAERQRDVRGPILDGLERRWRAGWNGNETPQVTVSSSSTVFAAVPRPVGALMLADPRKGLYCALAKGDFDEVRASRDGRYVAVMRFAEDRSDALNEFGRRGEVDVYDIGSCNQKLVYSNPDVDLSPSESLAWSPSGDALLFAGRPIRDAQNRPVSYGRDLHAGIRLYEWDGGAKSRRLSSDDLFHGSPDINQEGVLPIGWMGGHPVAIAAHHVAAADSASASTQSSMTLEYGMMRDTRLDLYVFNDAGNENLTGFAKASVNRFLVPEGADFAFVVADGALWKVAPGKSPQRMTPAVTPVVDFGIDHRYPAPPLSSAYYRAGSVERISVATLAGQTVGRSVLDIGSGNLTALSVPGEIVATAPDQMETFSKVADGWTTTLYLNDGASRVFTTFSAAMKGRAVAPVEKFTFQYNGKPLTGWVVLPPDGGSKLPAVVSVYGGAVYGNQPPSFTRTDFPVLVFDGQLLAQQGYAVIYPSTPLGAGADTNLMSTLADEVIAAVDALAANGTIDPARVGVMGQSFGGFSTAAILSERSDRFKAGIAMAGVYDWVHGYGLRPMEEMLDDDDNLMASETMLIESSQAQLEKPFWEAPDAYIRNSPIFRADKIDTPLLLLHGDLDLAVTGLSGAERLYNAMLRAGKRPTLVRYWGEGHVAQSDWAMRDQWMRITTWFGVYLKGEKPQVMR
jgi:dipeptidyl aminopeptidase/acylaminoacyl peptidase